MMRQLIVLDAAAQATEVDPLDRQADATTGSRGDGAPRPAPERHLATLVRGRWIAHHYDCLVAASVEGRPTADGHENSEAHEPTDLPHVPLVDDAADFVPVKPTWRGWIHAVTAPVSVAGGIVLIVLANGTEAKWASAVFALTSLLLFGNSALYHRIDWSPPVKRTLKRIDHANIFLLIAGTYTPLSLLALPSGPGVTLLSVVWGVALAGIGFRVFWIGAPRWLYVIIYIGLGWAALSQFGPLFAANTPMMVLFLVGGILYTLGARRIRAEAPQPVPGQVRVPRDLPHLHGARLRVPLDGDADHRAPPRALTRPND